MTPILWSFRRCPYAIRARLAVAQAGVQVELREVVLRNKPDAFLAMSPDGTVPCLVLPDGVISESLDIMHWALGQQDPANWLDMPGEGAALIAQCDGPFKHALDRVKYASRYPGEERATHLAAACGWLQMLEHRLEGWLFGRPTLADMAILPFIRQFAFIEKPWFDAQPWPALQDWLARFLDSPAFAQVMRKHAPWQPGQAALPFP
jgi:glutathione S-transferase